MECLLVVINHFRDVDCNDLAKVEPAIGLERKRVVVGHENKAVRLHHIHGEFPFPVPFQKVYSVKGLANRPTQVWGTL